MKSVYIVSYSQFSGKTAFAVGLGLCLKEEGLKVGYFKPISVGTEVKPGIFVDRDVTLMKHVLGINKPLAEIAPPIKIRIGTYQFGRKFLEDPKYYLNPILEAYNKIKDEFDFLIIEGRHRIHSLFTFQLDAITLSKALNSKIFLVSNGVIDDIILLKTLIDGMGGQLLGTIFNSVNIPMIEKIKGELTPLLERYKVKFYGFIPEVIELVSPTVEEYWNALGGQLLVGEEYKGKLVESVHIGAMRTESAMKVLKRFTNYALITGGDRSDLIMNALETDISFIILTGNLYPDIRILIKAEEKKVPVLLVPHETKVTYDICWTVKAGLTHSQTNKIDLIKKLIKENINWKRIYEDA
ncbi:MAG TPA: DRTGG domain-containing protein [Candidatus Deferrimicrobium sp.]|nr:DRTGG domain-containing protein [Candidatus Deferrimicrobium sp.]